jgi:hypothetical protein
VDSDVYRPPKADLSVEPGGPSAGTKLYSPLQVAAATLLGLPIAGALLMASNFRALGAPRSQRKALIAGVAGSIAVAALAWVLPEHFPGLVLPIAYIGAVGGIANSVQGESFRAHIAAGGLRRSNWMVLGIGLACLVGSLMLLAVPFVILLVTRSDF